MQMPDGATSAAPLWRTPVLRQLAGSGSAEGGKLSNLSEVTFSLTSFGS